MFVQAQIKDWDSSGCMVEVTTGVKIPTLKCLEVVFGNLLIMSGALIVLVLFIMFIAGSFQYLTSFGNPEKVKKAQGTFRYAILGLVLFISAYLIINTICVLFLGGFGSSCKLFQLNIPGS